MAYEPPPPFMPYEPFLLGVGVVFNLLISDPVYEQRRVDLATFRAVPASTWGHCPQVLYFTIVWDTPGKEKVAKWSFAPASVLEGFNEICAAYGPKKPYKTREKRQSCQIDPCLPPYLVTHWVIRRSSGCHNNNRVKTTAARHASLAWQRKHLLQQSWGAAAKGQKGPQGISNLQAHGVSMTSWRNI